MYDFISDNECPAITREILKSQQENSSLYMPIILDFALGFNANTFCKILHFNLKPWNAVVKYFLQSEDETAPFSPHILGEIKGLPSHMKVGVFYKIALNFLGRLSKKCDF